MGGEIKNYLTFFLYGKKFSRNLKVKVTPQTVFLSVKQDKVYSHIHKGIREI